MARQLQKRTLKTRAKLVEVATDLVAQHGYGALRTEEVVLGAGVAKGTFFSHFKDKDALMDLLIGGGLDACLDDLEAAPNPPTVEAMIALHLPMLRFMTQERYVFDVILRLSGAAAQAEIGVIATTFGRYLEISSRWFPGEKFRRDVPPALLAEGMQAFLTQAMALHFCTLHAGMSMEERLSIYLRAWLLPSEG